MSYFVNLLIYYIFWYILYLILLQFDYKTNVIDIKCLRGCASIVNQKILEKLLFKPEILLNLPQNKTLSDSLYLHEKGR